MSIHLSANPDRCLVARDLKTFRRLFSTFCPFNSPFHISLSTFFVFNSALVTLNLAILVPNMVKGPIPCFLIHESSIHKCLYVKTSPCPVKFLIKFKTTIRNYHA